MNMIEYTSREEQAAALAERVAGRIKRSINERGMARLALSGGTTPEVFLQQLDQHALPWENVRLTLTDERQVGVDHPRSNLRFLQNCLPTASQRCQWIPLFDDEQQQVDFAALAETLHGTILPLDIAVLGMGEDGHFASLFPGADNLQQLLDPGYEPPVAPVQTASQPEARISLSLSALLTAPVLHLLIQGSAKKQVLENASGLPVAALLEQAGEQLVVHYAD